MEDVLNYTKDDSEDFYAILGCDPSSTEEQIISEYRVRVLECHPDKHPNNPQAEERFCKLQKAKDILTDTSKRAGYDRWRRAKLAISYNQWCNMGALQMSMHWAGVKQQPMINDIEGANVNIPNTSSSVQTAVPSPSKSAAPSVPVKNVQWFTNSSSDLIHKFRNYEI